MGQNEILQTVLLGLLIFGARIADVTLGTMRIVFISRGQKVLAPVLGFFEVLIWLSALRIIMTNLTNPVYYVVFASGFAAGTFVGLYVEQKMALGARMVRIVTRVDANDLIARLRSEGYGVTTVDASGAEGPVNVIFSIVRRCDLSHLIGIVRTYNPRAVYTIEDVEFVSDGVLSASGSFLRRNGRTLARAVGKFK
jgi:uncharacterized protein YebE (UPF0316 family)